MDIIVDTREQLPLFTGIRYKLLVGDYSTVKLRAVFSIERKSPEDLYGTIIQGHVRFRNELIRAADNGIKLVLAIECSRAFFVAKKFKGGTSRKIEGSTLDKIMRTVETRYNIEVVWCRSRTALKKYVKERLTLEEKNHDKAIRNKRK